MATAAVAPQEKKMQRIQGFVNRFYEWRDEGNKAELDDIDGFIYWDENVNGGRCLDYDRDKNYRAGLREQARNLLMVYTRRTISVAGSKLNVATIIKDRSVGHTPGRFLRASQAKPGQFAESYLTTLKGTLTPMILRARVLGAHPKAVHNAIIAAEEEATRAFEREERKKSASAMAAD